MPANAVPELMTAEELGRLHLPGKSAELVRGRLIVREPPGTNHGRIAANLAYFISDHVRRNRLGAVFGQDTGFKIQSNPDTVRAPDVAFLRQARTRDVPDRGYAAFAPDLAVEVLSPEDRPGEVLAKIAQWLDAGTSLVWVIDPAHVEARVYRPDGSLTIIAANDALEGRTSCPGFPARSATLSPEFKIGILSPFTVYVCERSSLLWSSRGSRPHLLPSSTPRPP